MATLDSPVTVLPNNFIGLQRSESLNGNPPDTQVAAGPNHVLEAVNFVIRIFDKSGNVVATSSLSSFFGLDPASIFLGDPKVRFDAMSGRWFMSVFASQTTSASVQLAVSTGSDPTQPFNFYSFITLGSIPDRPAIGINDDKVILGATAFACDSGGCPTPDDPFFGSFQGMEYWVVSKADLVAGAESPAKTFFPPDPGFFAPAPAQSLSSITTLLMAAVQLPPPPDPTVRSIRVWSVTGVPGVGPGVTVSTVDLTPRPMPVPVGGDQPCCFFIDTGDNKLLDAVYRTNALWLTANVGCVPSGASSTFTCLKFIKIQRDPTTGALTIAQDFDFGINGIDHYFAAIQIDSNDSLGAVFSSSSPSEFASVYVSAQAATDPPNFLQSPVLVKGGEDTYDSPSDNRWGDYSGAGVDPVDQTIIWTAGEYARTETDAGNWGTWIAPIRIPLVPPPPFQN